MSKHFVPANARALAPVLDRAYRPDIDGLRAVAVVSVILFHCGITLVPGGFVGVDVFFVISGFLITRNILQDKASGEFTLLNSICDAFDDYFPRSL